VNDTRGSRILANTAYRALADAGSKLASLVLYVVMARELGDAAFGVFTFALMFVTILTSLARFGQDAVLVREVARDRTLLDRYFANTIVVKVALSAPVAAVALLVLLATDASRETLAVTAVLGAAVTVETVVATAFAAYQAYEQLRWVAAVLITQRFLTAAAGIAVLLAGGGVVAVAVIYLAGTLVALLLALAIQLRRVARPRLLVTPPTWPGLVRAAVPLGIAGVFGTIVFRVDTVILAAFEPAAVVGDYGAAYRLFEATLFLGWAVGAAVYPVFSRLRPGDRLRSTLERSLVLGLALVAPFAAGAAVASEEVIGVLFGEDFSGGATALRLLAPAILLFPVGYVADLHLVARGRQRAVAIMYGVVAAANVALNLALIPRFSLEAAALVTSLSELAIAAISLVLCARMLGGLAWARVGLAPLLAGAAAAAAMLPFRDEFLLASVAGSLVYVPALLLIERIVAPEEFAAAWRLVRQRAFTA
jgi:O-antigen/teichoic acid export membrane protein